MFIEGLFGPIFGGEGFGRERGGRRGEEGRRGRGERDGRRRCCGSREDRGFDREVPLESSIGFGREMIGLEERGSGREDCRCENGPRNGRRLHDQEGRS